MAHDKDRIDLRVYNTIVIYDVYTVGHTADSARDSLVAAIASGDAKPTEIVAKEVTSANSIRASWVEQTPYVAADVTDDEFESIKGNAVGAMWAKLYTKAPK
jgi:hypothetical protein